MAKEIYNEAFSRRALLGGGLKLGGFSALIASTAAFGAVCKLTPAQGEGPYYPQGNLEKDADLVQLQQGDPMAKGAVVFIAGTVRDKDCKPIDGALVEIWQACKSGKYNHSEDPNNLELDPNFQYWGRARTKADGRFLFRTIVPGHYPVGPNRYRPPHVHFKAHARGHQSLTTQMYFDPRSYDDPALSEKVAMLNHAENVPKALTVWFRPSPAGLDRDSKLGTFDIVLRKI